MGCWKIIDCEREINKRAMPPESIKCSMSEANGNRLLFFSLTSIIQKQTMHIAVQ